MRGSRLLLVARPLCHEANARAAAGRGVAPESRGAAITRRAGRIAQAALIAAGEPTLEKGFDKAVTRADRVVKRSMDATTDEIASELKAAVSS
jgi:hypothetical protein